MTTAALTTLDANSALALRLRSFGAKLLARTAKTSPRTTEKWVSGDAAPTWKHVQIMMHDDELLRAMLVAAGRSDVADLVEMRAKLLEAKRALDGLGS